MARQIILSPFMLNPEKPFPSMTAPVYLKGKMPANPKIPPCTKEFAIPMMTMIIIMMIHAVSCSINLVMKGIDRVKKKIPISPLTSLTFREISFAKKIPAKLNMKFGAFSVSPNTKSGLYFGKYCKKKSKAVSTAFHGSNEPIPKSTKM